MSPPGLLLLEEQLLCDVCLEVFREPVSLPCGHSFCRACVERHWGDSVQRHCPTCRETFSSPPQLRVNRFISDLSLVFRGARRPPEAAPGGPVSCDVCREPKQRAFRSCLMCLASYCEPHLKPHLNVSRLKQHQLTEPLENLESRVCPQHQKPLELFCQTDQSCVCMLCPVHEHKSHDVGLLRDQYEVQRAELRRRDQQIQEMVQERRQAVRSIRNAARLSRGAAQREAADGAQLFAALRRSLARAEAELVGTLEEQQRAAEERARTLVQELELEISQLQLHQDQLERLHATTDHLHFLQSLRGLSPAPLARAAATDWSGVRVNLPSHQDAVRSSVEQLQRSLGPEMEALLREAELNRLRLSSVDVTLDPDTAHSALQLSEDGRRVHHGAGRRSLPDNPERFDPCCCVLARQAFASGSFYFEVGVEGKSRWTVGVAKASVQRKGVVPLCPANGHWSVWLKNGNQYAALVGTPRPLSPRARPQRVGVYVDVLRGLVSFYDGDTAELLHSFTGCCFTEELLPFFSPGVNEDGVNSAPLVIIQPSQSR